jgi:pimeloyl-ACP methyl ester carboxylesterase/DNA-binding CsgD family transcriptional regulator
MGKKTQNQMLDLLDQAYQAADNPEQLDALLESANAYLFADEKNAVIADNLPHFADLDPHLEKHISRLESLIEQRTDKQSPGLSLGHHAQMVLSKNGRVLTTNALARNLFGDAPQTYIDDLPLSYDSVLALKGLIREITAGIQYMERVIYLKVEMETPRPVFGYCRAIPISADNVGLHVSLSYFEWSPALFNNLQQALDLSDSESLVLQGILKGQSHKTIAQTRNRSLNTVKTQAKAILHKAGCTKMNELVHLCTSIAYVIGLSNNAVSQKKNEIAWVTPQQNLHRLALPDGRTLAWYEYGDPKGKPVLYVHGFFQGPFFLDALKQGFLENGLRIIAPSRPYFGYTSAPKRPADFLATTCEDMLALMHHLNLQEKILVAAHHGGVSHAFRFAKRIEGKLAGMVMLCAGIPITTEHIRFMTKQARMTSVASRHAPSVLKLIATMGIKTYKRKGIQAFLEDHYSPTANDRLCIYDPVIQPKIYEGMFHLIEQGADAFVHDGRAQLADWTADLKAVTCQQHWIHGRHCHLMGAHFIDDYVRSNTNHGVEIIEDAGYNLLYQRPDCILEAICNAADWSEP